MLVVLGVGLVGLPYATLWASRSARVRRGALAVARRRWHTSGALVGVVAYAHVGLFAAAAAVRSYPDDRALHYDLATPRAWPATSARIVSAWGVVMRRRGWLWPAFALSGVLFALGPRFVGTAWWLALAADALVLAVCCLPFPQLVGLSDGFPAAHAPPESRTSTG